eukprot:s523_g33.t1
MESPDLKWLSRCYEREWIEAGESLPEAQPWVSDHLELRDTADRGRGLFLSALAKEGEILFVCEPFVIGSASGLQEATVMKLRSVAEEDFNRFMSLQGSDGTKFVTETDVKLQSWTRGPRTVQHQRSVDAKKVANVLRFNTLARDSLNGQGLAEEAALCGVWPLCSLINHSCLPNVQEHFLGDLLILRAARAIAAGEELLMSYVSPFQPRHVRRQRLSDTFEFSCSCERCALEAELVPEKRATEALKRLDAIVADARPGKLQEFTAELEKLAQQCQEVSRSHAVDGKESLLCSSFLAVFMGLAMARKRSKSLSTADAYAQCVDLLAKICSGSLYHLHWSFTSALESHLAASADSASRAQKAWQLFLTFAVPDRKVCSGFAKKMGWPQDLIDSVQNFCAEATPATPAAPKAPGSWEYSVQEEAALTVLSITLPDGLGPQDIDVDVGAAEVCVVAKGRENLLIRLPSAVDPEAAMPAKFKRTTRQLVLRLPVC